MRKNNFTPPPFFLRFFRWFCHPKLRDHIEGDLIEEYHERINSFGKQKADTRFIIEVLLLFRPSIIRPVQMPENLTTYGMFKNYFTIGWRNLLRNKGYSFINIGGLATGMTIAILIGLWVWDEITYDTYHENYSQLAQVMQHQTTDGKVSSQYSIPRPLETVLRNTYGGDFTYLSMASWTDEHILSTAGHNITQTGNYVQQDFPEMLTLKMLEGTRQGLKEPASILLSSSTAKALFGNADAMNQMVRIDNMLDVKVTGVYQDLPHNSSFRDMQFISSWELFANSREWIQKAIDRWDNNSFQLYAMVTPQADILDISEKIKNARADHTPKGKYKPVIYLHPMSDWHLRSEWKNGVQMGGRIQLVWMFGIVGVFVLILACINFMNLSTARSEKRSKEVGIRMTIGSRRGQLINQFLSESFLVVLLSFTLALLVVTLILPVFNMIADKNISIDWNNPFFWLISLLFMVVTSLLAGFYPALYLSSFQPVSILKSSFKAGRHSSLPRKFLVVVQCTVSVILVIGTLVVYEQIQFSKNRPMGYDRNGLITVQVKSPDFTGKYEVLNTELKNTGTVIEVSESSSPMTEIWNSWGGFDWVGKNPELQSSDFGVIFATPEYGKSVGWELIEGRDWSRNSPSDSTAIILNEAAVKFIGIKDVLGMEIFRFDKKFHVIGVIKDMIMESPYQPVKPNIYMLDIDFERVGSINIKLNPEISASESIAAIESVFRKNTPAVPFDFKFADEEYGKKFDSEELIGKLAYIFASLATFISCLGLIGLSSFVAEQHTKEIGIRKVLGASTAQLWKMLSENFIVLVLVSSVLASPIAYYFMNNWLLNYQYHVEISWRTFAITVFGAVMVTVLTVSYQALRAAMANPVSSLRSE